MENFNFNGWWQQPFGTFESISVKSSNTGRSIKKFMHGSVVARITLTIVVSEHPR